MPFTPPPPPLAPEGPMKAAIIDINSSTPFEQSEEEAIRDLNILWNTMYRGARPTKFVYTHTVPMKQSGPTCGLVALAMASSLTPSPVSEDELLRIAKDLGCTSCGEMFVARDLQTVADICLSDWFTSSLLTNSLGHNEVLVMEELFNGNVILVPYDSDKNNFPFQKKGHKAHWALLCGAIVSHSRNYVIARQGKSKHPAIWELSALDASNINLFEVDPSRTVTGEYNLKETLAGCFIILRRSPE